MAVIQSLQVFRGLAALAVVAHHAVLSTEAFVGVLPLRVESTLGMGYLGVDFFFVLSGFIIMYAHMGDEGNPLKMRRYAFKRFVRIFPPYLPLSLSMIALYAMLPSFSAAGDRDFSLFSSLLLLPSDKPPALSVAWTLVHEVQFYVAFLLFFISGRLLFGFMVIWVVGILAGNYFLTLDGWLRYPLSLLNIEFMFGVLAAWLVRGCGTHIRPRWWILSGVALALIALASLTSENLPLLRLLFSFGLASVVVGFALLECRESIAWPVVLLLIGNASYSVYLIHNPLLSATQRFAGWLHLSWLDALSFGIVVSILVGLAYYWLIERTTLDFIRSFSEGAARGATDGGQGRIA